MEFNSAGNHIPNVRMDCLRFMGHRFLSSTHLEFPTQKVTYTWVVGLSFDFVVLNLTKHSSYLIYNASLYFSSTIQNQYFEKYGHEQMIPVAANDVAFSVHAVFVTAITLFQILIYDVSENLDTPALLEDGVLTFSSNRKLSIQVFMTVIKYVPQAAMNFMRKSTNGFSIGFVLLDFLGGVTSYAQMAVQSIDQSALYLPEGNILPFGKLFIA
ncbi:unnamed protein product [Dovyalis caffra]|uniref:Uncharacterized protein n=1 Tax=Dovyalis caffra TaxID=77055 RepID=A0AAV1R794_9ROSI|nr:unnamed protein product [Dovyalis caffra]